METTKLETLTAEQVCAVLKEYVEAEAAMLNDSQTITARCNRRNLALANAKATIRSLAAQDGGQ